MFVAFARQIIDAEIAAEDLQILMPTVREDVAFGLRSRGLTREQVATRVDAILETYGLAGHADHPAHLLSGGQKQLLALAAVLAIEPDVLVLDEPTTLLDHRNTARVSDLIASLPQQVVLVTHDLEEAISLSDHIYLLSQGPRARLTRDYAVPIPRPRDPVRARTHPAFAPLFEKVWRDLSIEVEREQPAEAAE